MSTHSNSVLFEVLAKSWPAVPPVVQVIAFAAVLFVNIWAAPPVLLPASTIWLVNKFNHLLDVPPKLNATSLVGSIGPPLFNWPGVVIFVGKLKVTVPALSRVLIWFAVPAITTVPKSFTAVWFGGDSPSLIFQLLYSLLSTQTNPLLVEFLANTCVAAPPVVQVIAVPAASFVKIWAAPPVKSSLSTIWVVKKFNHLLTVLPRLCVALAVGIIGPPLFNWPAVVMLVGNAKVTAWFNTVASIWFAVPVNVKLWVGKSTFPVVEPSLIVNVLSFASSTHCNPELPAFLTRIWPAVPKLSFKSAIFWAKKFCHLLTVLPKFWVASVVGIIGPSEFNWPLVVIFKGKLKAIVWATGFVTSIALAVPSKESFCVGKSIEVAVAPPDVMLTFNVSDAPLVIHSKPVLPAFLARTCPAVPKLFPASAMFSVKKFCHLLDVPPKLVSPSVTGIIIPVEFNWPLVVMFWANLKAAVWLVAFTISISLVVPTNPKLWDAKSTVNVGVPEEVNLTPKSSLGTSFHSNPSLAEFLPKNWVTVPKLVDESTIFFVKKFCHLLPVAPRFTFPSVTGIIMPVLFNWPGVVMLVGKAIFNVSALSPVVVIWLAVPNILNVSVGIFTDVVPVS